MTIKPCEEISRFLSYHELHLMTGYNSAKNEISQKRNINRKKTHKNIFPDL